jgi:hypothetical protein
MQVKVNKSLINYAKQLQQQGENNSRKFDRVKQNKIQVTALVILTSGELRTPTSADRVGTT